MRKKAQVSMYVSWFFVSALIIAIAAVLAPAGIRFNTELYSAGEDILENSFDSIEGIQDENVRTAVNASVVEAQQATTDNIDILGAMYQYGWVVVLVISGIIFFLYSRRIVEYQQGFI